MSMHLLLPAAHPAGPYRYLRTFGSALLCHSQMADRAWEAPKKDACHIHHVGSHDHRQFYGKPHVSHTQIREHCLCGPRQLACSPCSGEPHAVNSANWRFANPPSRQTAACPAQPLAMLAAALRGPASGPDAPMRPRPRCRTPTCRARTLLVNAAPPNTLCHACATLMKHLGRLFHSWNSCIASFIMQDRKLDPVCNRAECKTVRVWCLTCFGTIVVP